MSDNADFLFESAPLVEVIVEVRWEMIALQAIPGAAVDPLYQRGQQDFLDRLEELGFGHVERLSPPNVPMEMLAGQPVLRVRPAPGRWPLYQLGPGLFTCNIVPPYKGWAAFRSVLEDGLACLYGSVLLGAGAKPISVEILYLDAFDAAFGHDDFGRFVREDLGIRAELPEALVQGLGLDPHAVEPTLGMTVPLRKPEGARFVLQITKGLKERRAAAICELRCIANGDGVPARQDAMMEWFDTAHSALRTAFLSMCEPVLERRMGKRVPIGGGR